MRNALKYIGAVVLGIAVAIPLFAGALGTIFIVQQGGTGVGANGLATGDLLYGGGTSAGALSILAPGTSGQVLELSGGVPTWATPAAGFSTTSAAYWFTQQTTSGLTEGSNLYFTNARAQAAISISGLPLIYSGGVLGINQANTSQAGYLSSTDWNTFNNKLSAEPYWVYANSAVSTSTPVLITASTTIGNGTAAGGLTVNGTATTTSLVTTNFKFGTASGLLLGTSGAVTNYGGSTCSAGNVANQIGASGALTCVIGEPYWVYANSAVSTSTPVLITASTTIGNGTAGLTVSGYASSTLGARLNTSDTAAAYTTIGYSEPTNADLLQVNSSASINGYADTADTNGLRDVSNSNDKITLTSSGNLIQLISNSIPTLIVQPSGASSTALSALTAYFGATATSSFSSAGALTLATPLVAGSGGTAISNPSAAQVLVGSYAGGGWQQIATSSLGLAVLGSNTFTGTQTVNNLTINGTCTGCTSSGVIADLGAQYSPLQSGSSQTLASSSPDANLGMTIVSASNVHTFTPYWIGTLSTARGGLGGNFGSSNGALSISGGTVSAGTLGVANGGTGAATFGQGWLSSSGGTNAFTASTSPTVNYITATSTTATSTFAYGINLAISGGCLAVNGVCISTTASLWTTNGNNIYNNNNGGAGSVGVGTSTPSGILAISNLDALEVASTSVWLATPGTNPTVPANTIMVSVQAFGAGGGGNGNSAGGGGGSGAYIVGTTTFPSGTITIIVGAGGLGGNVSGAAGSGGTGFKAGGNGVIAGGGCSGGGAGGGGSTEVIVNASPYIASGGGGAGNNGQGNGATGSSGGAGGVGGGTGCAGGGGGSGTVGSNGSSSSAGAGGTGGTTQTGTNGNGNAGGGSGGGGGSSAGRTGNGNNGGLPTGATGSGGAAAGASGTGGDSGGGGSGGSTATNGGQPGAGGGGGSTGATGGSGEVILTFYSLVTSIPSNDVAAEFVQSPDTLPSRIVYQVINFTDFLVEEIDMYGHLFTGGVPPTCGTGCTSVTGDDRTMEVLTGSSVSSVTVNFGETWSKHPICVPTDESGVTTGVEASTTVTTVTLSLPTALTSKNIGLICQSSTNFTY